MLVLKGFNDENLIKILGVLCNKSMCYESERKWKIFGKIYLIKCFVTINNKS